MSTAWTAEQREAHRQNIAAREDAWEAAAKVEAAGRGDLAIRLRTLADQYDDRARDIEDAS